MDSWAIAILVKPFAFLAVWVVFCYPVLRVVRKMKDGRLKRFLLRPIGKQPASRQGW